MASTVPTILAVAGLLGLMSILAPLADRMRVPYTTLLAVVGVGIGVAIHLFGHLAEGSAMRGLSEAVRNLEVGSDGLLYIFLPVVLFAAGLTLDARRLFDEIGPVLLLAVVAVIVTTGVVAGALQVASGAPLVLCLLVGAIVATTDPAAVLAIFRDLGAPRRLTVLVEGESLFNDAAAIALFALLLGMITGQRDLDPMQGAIDFVYGFAGGVAAGYVMARAACALTELLDESPLAEITLTVALAYLTFIVCQRFLGVSGVVAVVTAALVIGTVGRTRISPMAWDGMLVTWEQLAFWANSLIFLIASLTAPQFLAGMTWADVGLVLVVSVAALAARALVLYLMLPVLSAVRLARPMRRDHRAIILIGGLRGAVTLALAIAVTESPYVSAEAERFVAVLATGFVLVTLLIQAPALGPAMRLLGLDRLSRSERALRDRVIALSQRRVQDRLEAIAGETGLDPRLCEQVEATIVPLPEPALDLSQDEMVQVGLVSLANRERELCLAHFKARTVSRRMAPLLVARAGRMIDAALTGGLPSYEATAREEMAGDGAVFRGLLWLHRRFGVEGPLARRLADRFELLLVSHQILGDDTGAVLAQAVVERVEATRRALEAMDLQYPRFAEAVRARFLALAALRLEDDAYREKMEEALISREVFADLHARLKARRLKLAHRPDLDLGLRLFDMIRAVPLFAGLDGESLREVGRCLRPRLALPDERVVRAGERGDAMYFIGAGAVEVRLPDGGVRLGTGDFFGELALLTRQPRTADVRARGFCHLLVLDGRDFRRLLRRHPELRRGIESVAHDRLAANEPGGHWTARAASGTDGPDGRSESGGD